VIQSIAASRTPETTKVDPGKIKDIHVVRTVVGGSTAYKA
jgi:hypothetical protein